MNQDVWGYELGSIRGNEQQHYVNSMITRNNITKGYSLIRYVSVNPDTGASVHGSQFYGPNPTAGGNWAKNAGKYLAEDDTTFKVDWVRWLQNDEQKAASEAYYADASKITGVNDVVMNVGETPDLLKGISTPKENYIVDYSPTQKIARESSLLIVLTSSLNVKKGATLSSNPKKQLEDFSVYVFGMSYQILQAVMSQQRGIEKQCRN